MDTTISKWNRPKPWSLRMAKRKSDGVLQCLYEELDETIATAKELVAELQAKADRDKTT